LFSILASFHPKSSPSLPMPSRTDQDAVLLGADRRTDIFRNGKTKEFLNLQRSLKSRCTALATLEPEAADAFYRSGVAAYRRNEISAALSSFEATLAISPEHELALQYIDLIRANSS
jgi:tetratricopeptide (TPR) repeat protein